MSAIQNSKSKIENPGLPRISVLIPAYNAAKTVRVAIESVLAQTVPVSEIVVVDDGSTDNTAEIVARYGPRVRLIRQANGGPAAARNHAARESSGDWLALLDADDSWLPHKIERQIARMESDAVGIVHSFSGDKADRYREPIDFESLWNRNQVATSTVVMRRLAFEQTGGFDEDRALIAVEDYNLWLRFAASGWQFALCPEKLVCYTPAPGNLSSQTERFAKAELCNAENIAKRLNLPAEQWRQKRLAIHTQYGRDLFYYRQMSEARQMLSVPLRENPNRTHLLWWLATFVPRPLLDLRRKQNTTTVLPFSPSR